MDLNNTFGAAYIGLSASVFAFGILSAQIYAYFDRYPLDRPVYKLLVTSLWLFEALHIALTSHFFYVTAISNWGNLLILVEKPLWSLVLEVFIGAVVGAIVKGCLAMRVWRFSKHNIWITSVIVICTVVQLGFSLWYTIAGFQLDSLANLHSLFGIGTVALALGAFTDIFTALALCYYLLKLKSDQQRSNSIVNHLMLYAINTGLLTSTFSGACLISYALMPQNFIFIGIYFVLCKLYSNSLLATLNTRKNLRGRGRDTELETVPTFVMEPRLQTVHDIHYFQDAKLGRYSGGLQVGLHREVAFKVDQSPVSSSSDSKSLPYYGFI